MTLRLILMRHAKSDWSAPSLPDHDRALNARGRTAARALGGWIRARGYHPDLALCSTALRTRQTLAGLELDVATRYERQLYNAEPATILSVIKSVQGANCVLVVAHNPGIAWLAQHIVKSRPAHPRFDDYPTGATLVSDFAAPAWSDLTEKSGTVVDFTVPKDL